MVRDSARCSCRPGTSVLLPANRETCSYAIRVTIVLYTRDQAVNRG